MNIIHVAVWPYVFTAFRMPLLKRQKELFDRVVLFSLYEKKHVEKLYSAGFEINNLKTGTSFGKYPPNVLLKLFSGLLTHLKKNKYDIIVGHQPMGGLIGILAGSLAGVPVRIYSTGGLKYFPEYKSLANLLYKYGELFLIRIADAVLTVNREDFEFLKKIKSLAKKAYYVGPKGGSGVNIKEFNPAVRKALYDKVRDELNFSDDTAVIGYTGRIVWEKGFKEIIKSSNILKENGLKHVFMILGEGPDQEEIKKRIQKETLEDNFRFPGYRFNVNYYMASFDLFILPSYREGLPISLLESMAMGIPCIATNIRGNRELIDDKKTGRLIPAKNTKALADTICSLVNDWKQANTLGIDAANDVALKYSEESLVEKTVDLFMKIAKNKVE